ncbi:MAG: ThiF family adenylyltransferase [Anaerolineae bacterium]
MNRRFDRYVRQMIYPGIGQEGQEKLLSSAVAIIGCGATGSVMANNLTRAGVKRIKIADRDYIELNNLQRQILFDEQDIERGLPKAVAAAEKLRAINSDVEIEALVTDVNAGNVEGIIEDVDLVLDGTDNFETRYLINDACVKLAIPWIYCGVIASYGMTMNILPGQTPCLRCLFTEAPAPGTLPTCDTAGVLNSVVGAVASIASAEAFKLLLKRGRLNSGLIYVDLWENSFEVFDIQRREEGCLVCGQGRYEYLTAAVGTRTTAICGRDAVQVTLGTGQKLSFPELAAKLEGVGEVSYNQFMLRFKIDGYELTVFPDARAIIKGTVDEGVAKSLYAKYVGT